MGQAIITAAICVTAIGLICAIGLVIAAVFMSVKENEKEKQIRECLPGANCGACGFTGCDGYAKALANGEVDKTNLCIPGADAVSHAISDVLGTEFEDTVEQVATIRCCGNCENTSKKAEYQGIESCSAVKLLFGGDGTCTFGCLGRGDCAAVCPHDAICMDEGIARVDSRKCVGCGLCAKACPQHIIHMMADVKRQVVSCSNTQKMPGLNKICSNACISCGICAKKCPEGAITMVDNLPNIDYDKCTGCGTCSTACPRGVIKTADYSGKHRF